MRFKLTSYGRSEENYYWPSTPLNDIVKRIMFVIHRLLNQFANYSVFHLLFCIMAIWFRLINADSNYAPNHIQRSKKGNEIICNINENKKKTLRNIENSNEFLAKRNFDYLYIF